jgi:hypothetical protein
MRVQSKTKGERKMKDPVSVGGHPKARRRLTIVGLLIAVMALPAFAADFAYVSVNGADLSNAGNINGCLLITSPCRTITHALQVVSPGSTIDIIASGTYDSFTATNAITVQADPGVTATIDVLPIPTGGTSITINAPGANVVLRGLTVTVAGGDGIVINDATGKGTVALEGLRIDGAGGANGINFEAGAQLQIENCTVSHMANNGVQLTAAGATIFVSDVEVLDNGQSGILLSGSQTAFLDGVHAEANAYGVYAAAGAVVDIRNSTAARSFWGPGFDLDATTADTTMLVSKSTSLRNVTYGVAMIVNSGFHGHLTVESSVIEGNVDGGIIGSGTGGGTMTVTDSKITRNTTGANVVGAGINFSSNGTNAPMYGMYVRNVIQENNGYGVLLGGTGTVATLEGNVLSGNSNGISLTGATAYSRGDNTFSNNRVNVAGGSLTPLGGL